MSARYRSKIRRRPSSRRRPLRSRKVEDDRKVARRDRGFRVFEGAVWVMVLLVGGFLAFAVVAPDDVFELPDPEPVDDPPRRVAKTRDALPLNPIAGSRFNFEYNSLPSRSDWGLSFSDQSLLAQFKILKGLDLGSHHEGLSLREEADGDLSEQQFVRSGGSVSPAFQLSTQLGGFFDPPRKRFLSATAARPPSGRRNNGGGLGTSDDRPATPSDSPAGEDCQGGNCGGAQENGPGRPGRPTLGPDRLRGDNITSVPEPGTIRLLALGVITLGLLLWFRRAA